jgi:hypothetical protein
LSSSPEIDLFPNKAEAKYSAALETAQSDGDYDDDDEQDQQERTTEKKTTTTQGEGDAFAVGQLILKLTARVQGLQRKIRKLEGLDTLAVDFTTKGGRTADLRPGVVTAVSFLETPLVWCPAALANERPAADVKSVVEVRKVALLEIKDGAAASQILTDEHLNVLYAMLDKAFTGLRKLHDDGGGADRSCASYRAKVNGNANVLLVVQTAAGQVFGGFHADVSSAANSGWSVGDTARNFLFSLTGAGRGAASPVKIKSNGNGTGLHFYAGHGFTMGGGHDLFAFGDSAPYSNKHTYTVAAPGFSELPAGTSINGTTTNGFVPTRMEVYQAVV